MEFKLEKHFDESKLEAMLNAEFSPLSFNEWKESANRPTTISLNRLKENDLYFVVIKNNDDEIISYMDAKNMNVGKRSSSLKPGKSYLLGRAPKIDPNTDEASKLSVSKLFNTLGEKDMYKNTLYYIRKKENHKPQFRNTEKSVSPNMPILQAHIEVIDPANIKITNLSDYNMTLSLLDGGNDKPIEYIF